MMGIPSGIPSWAYILYESPNLEPFFQASSKKSCSRDHHDHHSPGDLPPGAAPQGRHLHFTEDATLHNDSKNTWDGCGRLPDPNLTFTMKKMANTAAKNSSRGTGSTPLGSTLRGLKKPGPGKWMKMGWYQPYIYIHCIYTLVGGIPTPLKKILVSWDDEIPIHGKIKAMFQTTHQ